MLHVSLQDFFQWSEQPHKAFSLDHSSFQLSLCNDISSSGCILEECQLSEVVSCLILLNLRWCLSSRQLFCSDCFTRDYDIEPVTVLGVSLSDDGVAGVETRFLDYVCNFGPLIVVKTLKHRHSLQEILVFVSLVLRCIFHDMIKGHTVKLPKKTWFLCNDSGCSWCIVEQSKFSKCVTWLIGPQLLGLCFSIKELEAVKFAFLNNVEQITLISLLDNLLVCLNFAFLHGINYNV